MSALLINKQLFIENQSQQPAVNIICTTLMCIQQYLGIGYVVAQSQNFLIYSNYKEEYVCTVTKPVYQCEKYLITQ